MVEPSANALSDREIEILRLVATGVSNKEIAQNLAISPNTVKVHLRNIFAKINVASRTEATLYAIRNGYAPVPTRPLDETQLSSAEPAPETEAEPENAEAAPAEARPPLQARTQPRRAVWIGGGALLLIGLAVALGWAVSRPPAATPAVSPTPMISRWEPRAPLSEARPGLALAVYANQIYAIGGETQTGVTGRLERYDPTTDQWTRLADKPSPVADASAVVIGGRIYVLGGRLATGAVSDHLEAYDPRQGVWEARAPLPAGRSGPAAVAYEGKLYVFGGWDGAHYMDRVDVYNPELDRWETRHPMPTARGLAGAAVSGERIFVIGGTAGNEPLTTNEVYWPANEPGSEAAWQTAEPLPLGLTQVHAIEIAGALYLVGQAKQQPTQVAVYFPQLQKWQILANDDPAHQLSQSTLTALQGELHLVGSRETTPASSTHLAFQVVYTTLLPAIGK